MKRERTPRGRGGMQPPKPREGPTPTISPIAAAPPGCPAVSVAFEHRHHAQIPDLPVGLGNGERFSDSATAARRAAGFDAGIVMGLSLSLD